MKKKASVFITAFIVAIAIAIFMLLNSAPQSGTRSGQYELPEHYAESTANFMYHSLDESGTLATYELGKDGLMDIDNGYWMSYSLPHIPSVKEVKENMEGRIKTIMNTYLSSINGKEISGLDVTSDAQISKIVVNVEEDGVYAGRYDNVFTVTAESTGKVEFTPKEGGEATTYQETSFNVPIENWRFWYIYRKMAQWALQDEFSVQACNVQPQYGIRGNDENCNYVPVDLNTAKKLLDDSVKKLNDSFDRDGLCIWGCSRQDPDCEGTPMETGTCAEDGFCSQGCPSDPDCALCNQKDPYMNCTWEMICGQDSVKSEHNAIADGPCQDKVSYNGLTTCPGWCVDGCEYDNIVENCQSGACTDPYCPKPGTPDYDTLVPPCNGPGEIEYTRNPQKYQGETGVPIDPGSCFGIGTKYTWSLIAEVTCQDTRNRKPVTVLGFDSLPFKIRIHQYFKQRYHDVPRNPCQWSSECVNGPGGGGGGGGEPNDGETGGGGGHSDPSPHPSNP